MKTQNPMPRAERARIDDDVAGREVTRRGEIADLPFHELDVPLRMYAFDLAIIGVAGLDDILRQAALG
jgi:hypothetical protein